ncbi:MAG TPA: hypothetical protein VHX44_07895 [Planctomycetota bacterium]|nr:hypothetical protein [Planctomycetota bacterium]
MSLLLYLSSYVLVRRLYQRELPHKPIADDLGKPFYGTVISGESLLHQALYVLYFPVGQSEWYVWKRPYRYVKPASEAGSIAF